MNCPQCESALLAEVFGAANPIRCASCGKIFLPPNQKASEVSRFSRRSLWLGLSSILLLFLTGIPAIWYGVKSLLQMRFVRSRRGDRKAAAVGVALGVIFGLFGTATVGLIGGVVISVRMSIEETTDPQRMGEILAMIGTLDIPDGFQQKEANRFRGQFDRVNWQDGSNAENMEGRIRLIGATKGSQIGDIQISNSKTRYRLYRDIKIEPGSQKVETLSWNFAEKTRDVRKTTEAIKDSEFNSVLYWATADSDESNRKVALVVSIREPGKYSEEQVKKIFESFQPNQ